jgi:hypothetical protein
MTADNRPIIAGIATHGLPLELVLRAVQADGPITSGVVLKTTQPETICSRIATAVADVYGPQYKQGVAASSVCFSPGYDERFDRGSFSRRKPLLPSMPFSGSIMSWKEPKIGK